MPQTSSAARAGMEVIGTAAVVEWEVRQLVLRGMALVATVGWGVRIPTTRGMPVEMRSLRGQALEHSSLTEREHHHHIRREKRGWLKGVDTEEATVAVATSTARPCTKSDS